jgi:natural product biosynthesis luciferase-like monooxygenase protein
MDFGIMFFSSAGQTGNADRYYLLKEAARFADQNGLVSIWTPERHFHDFGGLFPNPSVLSAAIAMITRRIQIRAGSLVSPLHHAIRIAEDWSVVDNLSNGRVAISFGSGWNIQDFVFFPDRYRTRQAFMYEQIVLVQDLWHGKSVVQIDSMGKEVSVGIFPKPVQRDLPVWITSSGNIDTFVSAGSIGANLLTHLLGQDIYALAGKISAYREARAQNGHDPAAGIVSLMLHTHLDANVDDVKERVRAPLREYLRSAVSLEKRAAEGGGAISGGHNIAPEAINEQYMEELLDLSFERYFHRAALLGTPDSCFEFIRKLESIGVNEIACLIDFGITDEQVLRGLPYLADLQTRCASSALSEAAEHTLQEFTAEF